MSLCPLTEAAIHLREAARAFEQAKCPELAHDADVLARTADLIDAARDAKAESDRMAAADDSAIWEQTTGRAFDAAVARMPTDTLQRIMGAV
jgi:hypothetical protein